MQQKLPLSPNERRNFRRKNTIGIVSISHRHDSRVFEGKVFNTSAGGLSCTTDLPLNILSPVEIRVEQSPEMPRNERYSGKVVWGRKTGDLDSGTYRYGIKFINSV